MATIPELDRYLRHDEIMTLLHGWAAEYPGLIELESLGTSPEGRDLISATVTDRRAGPHADKPAIYIEGNIHAGEVLPSVVALRTIHDLVSRADDPEVAALLERYTFYVRPRVSPDGAEVYLTTPYRLRSAAIPWPSPRRQPGLHPEDVNGDGHITVMRIADPLGEWCVSPLDPRIMVRWDADRGPVQRYQLVQEGTVEGPVGPNLQLAPTYWGLDFNRSFPHNWQPEHAQMGAGPYPLFVPETRATADFFLAHPNIFAAVLYHTAGGFVFTLPSSQSRSAYTHDDLETDYLTLSQHYTRLSGCPAFQSYDEETDTARSGSLMDWAYSQMGVLTWVPELWDIQKASGARPEREAPFQTLDESEEQRMLEWSDRTLGGEGFVDWQPFDHPQLGPVEIGGWTFKYTHQNCPPSELDGIAAPAIDWSYLVARAAPRLEFESASVTPIGAGTWLVEARVVNAGYLPTNVCQQAIDVRRANPVTVTIEGTDIELPDGLSSHTIGHLKGESSATDEPWRGPTAARRRADVRFLVRGAEGARVTVTARCPRAGVARQDLTLGEARGG
jgi:murein tripeptide amidase MpaA